MRPALLRRRHLCQRFDALAPRKQRLVGRRQLPNLRVLLGKPLFELSASPNGGECTRVRAPSPAPS